MKSKHKIFSILLVLALLLGPTVSMASAGVQPPDPCKFFYISIAHQIDGTKLGLSLELPVIVEVYYGPTQKLIHSIPLSYRQLYNAQFRRGDYLIKVYSVELGAYVQTLEYSGEFPGCVKALVRFRLVDGVPTTVVQFRELVY